MVDGSTQTSVDAVQSRTQGTQTSDNTSNTKLVAAVEPNETDTNLPHLDETVELYADHSQSKPSDSNNGLSEYEQLRERNIQKRKEMFAKMDFDKLKETDVPKKKVNKGKNV